MEAEVRGVYDVVYYIEAGSKDIMRVIAEDEDHAQEKFLRVWPWVEDIVEILYRGEA